MTTIFATTVARPSTRRVATAAGGGTGPCPAAGARTPAGRALAYIGKDLSREWRNIEIKAERKWGELLARPTSRGAAPIWSNL